MGMKRAFLSQRQGLAACGEALGADQKYLRGLFFLVLVRGIRRAFGAGIQPENELNWRVFVHARATKIGCQVPSGNNPAGFSRAGTGLDTVLVTRDTHRCG